MHHKSHLFSKPFLELSRENFSSPPQVPGLELYLFSLFYVPLKTYDVLTHYFLHVSAYYLSPPLAEPKHCEVRDKCKCSLKYSQHKCDWHSIVTQQMFLKLRINFLLISHSSDEFGMVFDIQRVQLYDAVHEALHKVVSNFTLLNLTKYQVSRRLWNKNKKDQ